MHKTRWLKKKLYTQLVGYKKKLYTQLVVREKKCMHKLFWNNCAYKLYPYVLCTIKVISCMHKFQKYEDKPNVWKSYVYKLFFQKLCI
jgi:hypothetical protein